MASAPPPTVLLVDDNADARESLGWVLQARGFDVLEAGTGRDALRLAPRRPDAVVLDVVLPDLSGVEVCRRLKADPDTAAAPVLMLSGRAVSDTDRVAGLDGGADAYLTKPADPAVVLAHLKALLRLRQAEAIHRRAAAVLEQTPDAFVTLDADWRFTAVNARAEAATGRPRAELLGRTLWEAFPEVIGTPFEAAYRKARAEHTAVEVEDECAVVGGRCESRAFPVDGGLGVFFRDVSARRRMEDRVRQAQKMEAVGQLAGGVAHDFNNLLTVINGYGELVADTLPPGDPCRDLVAEIRRAGDRAAGLTRQLLAFSRKAVVAPRPFDLNALVSDLGRMLGRLIGEDIDLAARLRPGLPPVVADPGQVEQVVVNLAVNARDAMPGGGRLTIETGEAELGDEYARAHPGVTPGGYALLAVSDTGTGIPADVLAHVFEPFFTTKAVGKGTGLGLATVHGIVRQAGGHVAVYTEVGVGTTFKVYLPWAGAAARAESGTYRRPAPAGHETVLLAEDDPGVRALARYALARAGYAVLEAGGGAEAVRLAREHAGAIDLLVTDVVMPGLGGPAAAGQVRAARPQVRVLYLSGYTDDAVVRHGVLDEEVHFLQKPFTPDALARKVREVLDAAR